MVNMLETRQLDKRYPIGDGVVDALTGINLNVGEGEFLAVMGPSGSGKSTLLHLLGGLDSPSNGDITLMNKSIAGMDDDELTTLRRREIGFIFQNFNLLPTLTCAENVALPLMLDDKKVSDHQEKIEGLLELVDLLDRKDHKPSQLSGGQQQRAAIARAFVNDPKIVMADEPTGNLDSKTGAAVLDILHDACKKMNTTVVMVTHDPMAASYADRVVFLNDGGIVHELVSNNGELEADDVIHALAELDS